MEAKRNTNDLILHETELNNLNWYAIYTRPRFEKKVYDRLLEKEIEAYLPLQRKLNQWSDRKKWIEIPLFTSYVFVHIDRSKYDEVVKTEGVVKYITFEGKAAIIRQEEIDNLKLLVDSNYNIDNLAEKIKPGEKVIINHGPLNGLKGELIQIKGSKKVMIRIQSLNKNLVVEIPGEYIKILD
ncbi:UpxY family transcription antiterminator [Bacteroidota bacterium]